MAKSKKAKAKQLRKWYPWLTNSVIREKNLYNFSPLAIFADRNNLRKTFNKAVRRGAKRAAKAGIETTHVPEIQNFKDYCAYTEWLIHWVPREQKDARTLYNNLVIFYYYLDQEPAKSLQDSIRPWDPDYPDPTINWFRDYSLSEWIVDFANIWGLFLDTPESAKYVSSFWQHPEFNKDAYMAPPSGYRTFNQFFARHVKPGVRPIYGLRDNSVVVSPADSTFVGWWQVNEDSSIVTKDFLEWPITELLKDSPYADRFKGGIFCHAFLNTYDYHRWHTPVQGTVLESRVIQGQAYLNVVIDREEDPEDGVASIQALHLDATDQTGYQFAQTRGLVVIDSPIGLVACLPMGMAQVSSVVITADVGRTLHKGEELGYFQFGGSDFVMVFEAKCNLGLIAQPNVHYDQGAWIGNAFPYTMR